MYETHTRKWQLHPRIRVDADIPRSVQPEALIFEGERELWNAFSDNPDEALKGKTNEALYVASIAYLMSWYSRYDRRLRSLQRIADQVSAFSRNQFRRQMEVATGKDPRIPQHAEYSRSTLFQLQAKGKQIATKRNADMVSLIQRDAAQEDIDHRKKFARNAGVFIAGNELSGQHSGLSQRLQQDAGGATYVWRTSMDMRVRPEHRQREGRVFSWNAPPDDGNPGQPPNCRCIAEPIASEFTEESVEAQGIATTRSEIAYPSRTNIGPTNGSSAEMVGATILASQADSFLSNSQNKTVTTFYTNADLDEPLDLSSGEGLDMGAGIYTTPQGIPSLGSRRTSVAIKMLNPLRGSYSQVQREIQRRFKNLFANAPVQLAGSRYYTKEQLDQALRLGLIEDGFDGIWIDELGVRVGLVADNIRIVQS
jgi:SPP1 gp7 family putative phage head morphogenesis protein